MARWKTLMTLCGALALISAAGCATLHLPWTKDVPKASARNPVVQIVCLWEQAEGHDPDGLPCRGFAGQILFLANRNATPVQVEGDVRIYLFDDIGTLDEQKKPLRQFDFDDRAWNMHLTKSALGPSYSVFVPYTRRGQHNAKCALRVRLSPKEGPAIFSAQSSLPLRGVGALEQIDTLFETKGKEEHVQAEVEAAMSRALQKSTTIPLTTSKSGGLAVAEPPQRGPSPAEGSTDERLARMERMLTGMLQQQAQAESRSSAVVPAHHESPARAAEEPPPRFRLQGRAAE